MSGKPGTYSAFQYLLYTITYNFSNDHTYYIVMINGSAVKTALPCLRLNMPKLYGLNTICNVLALYNVNTQPYLGLKVYVFQIQLFLNNLNNFVLFFFSFSANTKCQFLSSLVGKSINTTHLH